ncbi:hypothetical protein BH18ACT4_BH18ACT4_13470 [soil metagenome]
MYEHPLILRALVQERQARLREQARASRARLDKRGSRRHEQPPSLVVPALKRA